MNVEFFVVFPYFSLYVFRICSTIPYFILDVGNLCLLSFTFVSLVRRLSILLIFFKETAFRNIFLFSMSLSSVPYYFFPSVCFDRRRFLLLLFCLLEVKAQMTDLRLFLFSNLSLQCYNFPSQHCFSCVPQILTFFISFQCISQFS